MKGWHIFSHSVSMVVRNLQDALKITVVPVILGLLASGVIIMSTGFPLATLAERESLEGIILDQGVGAFVGPFFLLAMVFVIVELWIFVAWHRFILLEEYPSGWLPTLRGQQMLAYFGTGLMIGLIILVAMTLIGFVVMLLASVLPGGVVFASVILLVLGYLMFYRSSAMLPAAAIGKRLPLGEAWDATQGASGTLLVTGVAAAVAQYLMQYVGDLSIAVFLPLGIAFQIFATLFLSLVNVSILTTIYGHYVEGRPIA